MKKIQPEAVAAYILTTNIGGVEHYLSANFFWQRLPGAKHAATHSPKTLQAIYDMVVKEEWPHEIPQAFSYVYRLPNGEIHNEDPRIPFTLDAKDELELSL